ncbi:MAG: hypothetical protein CL933_19080 [Deltaproteobacteria bacterium]|jgi:HEAT repeat protein|nr:hypothetical protein [Deltaproteobacteria bacterium]
MRAALILLPLCLSVAASRPAAVAAPLLPDDLSKRSVEELLAEVRDKKNWANKGIYRELGTRSTQASFDALAECTKIVTSRWHLRFSHEAFEGFKSSEELSGQAIEFLQRSACGSEPMRSSAAAYGLTLFGEPAFTALGKVLKSSKDANTRSAAMAPLLPGMAAKGDKADFKTAYENLVLTYRVHRALGVDTFKAFAASGGVQLFEKKLADKKISAEVRGMMITALEETPDEEALELLMSGLKAKDPRILYETLRALARRGTDIHSGALQKLTRHKDHAVRHEALVSMARLFAGDPSFLKKALSLAGDRDPVARGAAAISLGELRTPEAIDALHKLLEDEEYTVRIEALMGVAIARERSSIQLLAERLDDLTGAERDRTHRELRLLTGRDFGTTSSRWAQWWRDEGADFSVPSLEDALEAESERDERRESNNTQSSFYGLSISSDRVCFVLDLSGSMNFRTKSGETRLSVLKSEMERFLGSYPSGDLFNMIFFGNDAQRWRPALTSMNDKVRSAAKAHVNELEAPGATAVYDGLAAAFEDPLVDTIYLLTDGGPTGGEMDDIDEIVMEVSRWNSLRHVVIHTVAVGRKSPLLAALSADSNGQYAVVD